MTKEELIAFGSSKVRNDSTLLSFYKEIFKEEFGYYPVCAGCSFSNDWDKLIKSNKISLTKKFEIMNPEFEIKDKQKIHTYTDAKGIKRRCSGFHFTLDFAIAYLTNGTEEEIELRKKDFKTLPNLEQKQEVVEEVTETKEPSISELKALYPQFAGAKDKKTLLKKIADYESKKELDS
jgi:hypothetical protein